MRFRPTTEKRRELETGIAEIVRLAIFKNTGKPDGVLIGPVNPFTRTGTVLIQGKAKNRNQSTNMKSFKFILIAILSSLGFAAYGGDTYKVDPVHSSVVFSIKHFGVTDFYGGFKQISGTVTFD